MRNLNESRAIRLKSIVISQIKENHTNENSPLITYAAKIPVFWNGLFEKQESRFLQSGWISTKNLLTK